MNNLLLPQTVIMFYESPYIRFKCVNDEVFFIRCLNFYAVVVINEQKSLFFTIHNKYVIDK